MYIILIALIVILIIIVCFQYKSIKERNKSLVNIKEELNSIVTNNRREKVMFFTDDRYLISILEQINNLLEVNQKINSNYLKTEMSMKRMLSIFLMI